MSREKMGARTTQKVDDEYASSSGLNLNSPFNNFSKVEKSINRRFPSLLSQLEVCKTAIARFHRDFFSSKYLNIEKFSL